MHRFLQPQDTDEVVIDLAGARFLEPVGLAAVAAHAEWHSARRAAVRVIAPRNSDCANYAARMGLGTTLDALQVNHELPDVRHHHVGPDVLLELQPFTGEGEAGGSAALAQMLFAAVVDESLAIAKALHQAVSEVGANVPQHSGLPHGYLAAQRYSNGEVLFAVSDAGQGLRARLREQYGDIDDQRATELAITKNESETGERGRGKGLAATVALLHANGGRLYIASGAADRVVYPERSVSATYANRWRGTLVQGSLSVAAR